MGFIKINADFIFLTDKEGDALEDVARELDQALLVFGPVGSVMQGFPAAQFVQADVAHGEVLTSAEVKELGLDELGLDDEEPEEY